MKTEILKLLRSSGEAVSGQYLCETMGVSRTAVWKVINQLKEEGYQIEAVRNKGYTIRENPDVVTKEELESRMQTEKIGRHVCYFPVIGSTNNTAKQLAEAGEPDGSLVIAEIQSNGKGRRGKGWESPQGTGIFMTLILKPQINPSKASMVTLVMALAVVRGVAEITGLRPMIKWPNDVVVDGRKICGILTEMSAEIDYINHIVIGAGINVNTESFPEDIADRATSLYIASGKKFLRAEIAAAVMKEFEDCYKLYLKSEDLSLVMEQYNGYLVNAGREVSVIEADHSFTGTAMGINKEGELLVETKQGIKNIYAGEVSVRGIYGYV